MIARRSAVLVATVTLAVALSACTPAAAPTPTPSPTGFASKEEAFAAAEATYRAYVDALNKVDLSDPATFEPVYALLDGSALNGSKKELTNLHAELLEKRGVTKVKKINRVNADPETSTVTVNVCLDVTDVDIVDASGSSVVPEGRNDRQLLAIELTKNPSAPRQLVISQSEALSDQPCG
ncbi:hypothetical protein [Microbacterium oleivorans]|uniref:Pseudouridylate synthase n=1 Tax=Microbacterium oleivorans TaxID=273677 RepID=A0A031FYZ9_9MICO|nr:hypothetical protein [Microbacterium oleivorans]EZP29492.1 Pseudouridylate synthase [Microbacterium oleivorans]